jgi:ABC-type branched-subunit amino acid transport system substrate-binding protein
MGDVPVKIRGVALCLVLVLVAAGCGSRLSDDELASGAGTGGGGAAPTATDPGDAGLSEGTEGKMIGSLPVPCSEGDQAPGPTPADTEGVSQDTIEIAVISDKAGQVKVPTASIEESMEAFVAWCNGLGGINGRTLELTAIDSKLFSHLEATKEACNAGVFALVGSGSVADNQGAQAMVDCGLVEVPGYTATAAKGLSENVVAPIPNPSDSFPTGAGIWIGEQYPDAIVKAGVIAPDLETTNVQVDRLTTAYESVGFDFIYVKKTGAIQENYATEVAEMKAEGVEWLTMITPVSETTKLMKDMKTQGFEPQVVDLGQQYYDPELLAEPNSEGALVLVNTVPFEEADDSPALQAYLAAYDEVDTDIEPTSLGVQAFSAGLLFATAARELGDDLTRDGLLEQLHSIKEWNGGGLHFDTNPGDNVGSDCFMYTEVVDGEFVRRWPEELTSWDCNPEYSFDLGKDYGGGAKASG